MKIYQKLATIQENIKGLGKNKESYNFNYVTGAKVLENIKPLMIKEGLLLKQEILNVKNERMDYITYDKKGNQKNKSEILYNVEMLFTWIDIETGEKDENRFFASGMNDWEKGLGSALTYGERYFLLKYFHINTDEDDIDNPERKEAEEATKQCTIEEKVATLKAKLDNEKGKEWLMKNYKVEAVEKLKMGDLNEIYISMILKSNKAS